jgi:hypothetical protein
MITFSPAIIAILENPSIETFYIVKIGSYATTSYFNNTIINNVTYLADGKLVTVDPPRLSTTVDRELYKVILTDSDYALGNLMQTGLVGQDFEVRLLFLNPATNLPLTNVEDTILVYKGAVDNIAYSIDTGNNGSVALAITGTSPMSNLDLAKPFTASKDFMRNKYPTDSCFDQVYEGSGPVNLKWGKG